MAIISDKLNNILTAVFGKDVRQALHDGLKAVNDETESTTARQEVLEETFDQLTINAGNSNAEVVAARVDDKGNSYETVGKRLNAFDSHLDSKANKYEINVRDFGAKGDGITDDTIAFKNAIKSAKGKEVIVTSGDYYISYLQLSGDYASENYVGSDVLNVVGRGNVNIISKSYVGETPPSNLGLEYGYTASAFSLNKFNKVKINNINFKGCSFGNTKNDFAFVDKNKTTGTLNAYNTMTKAITFAYCKNIEITNIYSYAHSGCVYGYYSQNIILNNVKSKNGQQAFFFSNCEDVYIDNSFSYDSRFNLRTLSLQYSDVNIIDRATANILYAVESDGNSYGLKMASGYGFVIENCINTRVINCEAYRSGSECFRVQGENNMNVLFDNCRSYQTRRYAFSNRNLVADVLFKNCIAYDVADISFWNGSFPTDKNALYNVTNIDDIDNYFAFRVGWDTNSSFFLYGKNIEIDNCKSISRFDKILDTDTVLPVNYISGFNINGVLTNVIDYGCENLTISDSTFYGHIYGTHGMIRLGLSNVKQNITIKNNILEMPKTTEISKFAIEVANISSSSNILIQDNKYNGHYYGIVFTGTPVIGSFISKNNTYNNSYGVNGFTNDTIIKAIFNNEVFNTKYQAIKITTFLRGVYFENCSYLNGIIVNSTDLTTTYSKIYFKDGNSFMIPIISPEVSSTSTNKLNMWKLIDGIKVSRIEYDKYFSATDDSLLIKKLIQANTSLSSTFDLMTVTDSTSVARTLKCRLLSGGTGLTNYVFSVSSLNIQANYCIYYDILSTYTIDSLIS